ncbi:MAG: hypothetical protein IH995_04520 [Proteobacteria bacterium]|nr:hypothetical protein [Pseudomonadota bacterium]
MKKPTPKKKPNPVARGLPGFKPSVVPGKTRYRRRLKHPKEGDPENNQG